MLVKARKLQLKYILLLLVIFLLTHMLAMDSAFARQNKALKPKGNSTFTLTSSKGKTRQNYHPETQFGVGTHFTLTYNEVIKRLIEGYPSMETFRLNTAAAKNLAMASWFSYGPNLIVNVGRSYNSGYSSEIPNSNRFRQNNIFYGIGFTLFDGGVIAFDSKALEAQAEVANLNAQKNINDMSVQATQAYGVFPD